MSLMAFASPIRTRKLPCKTMLQSQSMNPDFFGREDILRQLQDALQPSREQNIPDLPNVLRSVVVHGFGGIGKTQIAIQYAYSNIGQYDAIFWVQADGHEKIANGFTRNSHRNATHPSY